MSAPLPSNEKTAATAVAIAGDVPARSITRHIRWASSRWTAISNPMYGQYEPKPKTLISVV